YPQVSNLIETNPVSINGVKIGLVDKIFFHPDGSGKIIVKCIIGKDIKIPKNSIAQLYSSDLLGTRAIELLLGDSKEFIQSGDTLISQTQASLGEEVSKEILPIKLKAEELLSSIDSVLIVVQTIFNEQTRNNIYQSIESLKMTVATIEKTTRTIDTTFTQQATRLAHIVANAESISTNLKNNNENITNILSNLSSITDDITKANLVQTIENANNAVARLDTVIAKINSGEGSLGLLLNDKELYQNLDKSALELNKLLEDIRNNPEKYLSIKLFGK
ncbi:MAG: MCE family protein, partial [Bacteroidales bacterium]|nr:MCE family protein [Bacteroidales bacterium]